MVAGVGPGPFTGLRVGLVTAAAIADAPGIPATAVCSLDAIAAGHSDATPLLVAARCPPQGGLLGPCTRTAGGSASRR